MKQGWHSHGLLLFFTLIWGSNFILAELALDEMSPLAFSAMRFSMGGIFLTFIVLLGSKNNPWILFKKLSQKEWIRLFIIILIGAILAPWLGIEGLKQTDGGRASIWLALGPLFSIIIGSRLKTERYGFLMVLGLVLAVAGSTLLIFDGMTFKTNYLQGDLLLVTALLLTVLELHLIKPLIHHHGALPVLTLRSILGSMFYLAIAFPAISNVSWSFLSQITWIAVVFGGIVGISMGQWVKMKSVHAIGPTRVVMYGNFVPVITLGISMMMLCHDPSGTEWSAALLMISGMMLVQVWDIKNHRKEKQLADVNAEQV